MLKLVHDTTADAVGESEPQTIDLDELCRLAAKEMLAVALLAERRAYLEAHADELDATGRRLVVGNGYARPRVVTTGAGAVEVTAPRVDDRREDRRFTSAILPAYMRKSPKVTEVLPVLYLRGLSTGDFAPALGEFFGTEAGLSSSTVNRLTVAWQAEHAEWSKRDLSDVDYVYMWADGVHFNFRLEEDRLCCLVIVGVRPDGTKELVALADGYRESTDSWAEVLRGLRDRGLAAPVLAVGDGALGFWGALREVFPTTREQRCWVPCPERRRLGLRCPQGGFPAPSAAVPRTCPGIRPARDSTLTEPKCSRRWRSHQPASCASVAVRLRWLPSWRFVHRLRCHRLPCCRPRLGPTRSAVRCQGGAHEPTYRWVRPP